MDYSVSPDSMSGPFNIYRATERDAADIAVLVGELLAEIVAATGVDAFGFDLGETIARLADFIRREKYFVFSARAQQGRQAGFITLYESQSLYAQGVFGTIAELYVRPEYRSQSLGSGLIVEAKALASSRGWRRLEVTTPPLPKFARTLAFYERENFAVTGGRKLKVTL